MSLERLANLVGNPASQDYSPKERTNYVTEFRTVTPLVLHTVSPMLVGPSGSDFESSLYPRVGRCAVLSLRVDTRGRPDGSSSKQTYYSTGVTRGPSSRPYSTSGPNSEYSIISVVNTTPFEYFECHHLTVGRYLTNWHILGSSNPIFVGEVTETITDSTLGAVKLGYIPFKNLQSGDDLPDIRYMQELDENDQTVDIERPCANFLGGGSIETGTQLYVKQEAGGTWVVVAVRC